MGTWPIDFGKVRYRGKAPKNAPRWIWRCGCDDCRALPSNEGLHGPFKTQREAERDVEEFIRLAETEPDDMGAA